MPFEVCPLGETAPGESKSGQTRAGDGAGGIIAAVTGGLFIE